MADARVDFKIEVLRSDDWVAFYKDGMKVHEGHSMRVEEALDALEIPYKTTVDLPCDPDSFPEHLL